MAGGESSSSVAAVMSEESMLEVPVLDWKTAKKMKWPLPPRPRRAPPAPPRSRVLLTLDMAVEYERIHGRECRQPNIDDRTLRRTVSNRLAAQRSRMKRLHSITDFQTRSDDLSGVIDTLKPQVEALKEKKQKLEEENVSLRAVFEARANQSKIAERVTEELQLEIARLRENLADLCMNKVDGHGQIREEVVVQPKPYSIEFYQQRLVQMPEIAQPQPDYSFLDFDEGQGADEEVDHYLNLDDENMEMID